MLTALKRISPTTRQIIFAYVAAAALFVVGLLVTSSFASSRSTVALSTQAAFIGIVALGQTFAMLTGGVDLSVPWAMTSSATLLCKLADGSNHALWWAVPVTIVFGAGVGAINGTGITVLRVSPIVMTLAVNEILLGGSLLLTSGQPGAEAPSALADFAVSSVGPVRVVFLLWIVLGGLATFLLMRTGYGRRLYAVGTNEETARFAGIRTGRVRIGAYTVAGMASAIAGMLVAGFNQQVFIGLGDPYLFSSIAAVAVGGIAMAGGAGSYVGTAAGALVLAILSAVLLVMNISPAALSISFGAVILLTVSFGGKRVNPLEVD